MRIVSLFLVIEAIEYALKKEALDLFQTGFMKQMAEAVSYYVAPMFLGHRASDCTALEAKVNNGTIFFVECDGQPLAITADHVYAGI